jgi:hypothetical protein
MNINELYNPIDDAPIGHFDQAGDRYDGTIVKAELRDDQYGGEKIPGITLKLDRPTSDGDNYTIVMARSKQLRKVLGRAVSRAGYTRLEDAVGARLSVWLVEQRETTGSANSYKLYDATCGESPSAADSEFIGTATLGETSDDEPPF